MELRSLCVVAHTYCTEYFGLMQSLNALMLFKFFPSDPEGRRFAAVAVLYISASEGHIVADAVSFGTCPLPLSAAVPSEIARVCRTPCATTALRAAERLDPGGGPSGTRDWETRQRCSARAGGGGIRDDAAALPGRLPPRLHTRNTPAGTQEATAG